MKVNGIDVRKYNAKQLTVEVLPPSISLNYEIIPGALTPIEFDTDIPLGKINICMYFRGEDRNKIIRQMSAFLANFTKACNLDIDGYKGKYRAFATSSDYDKMKVKNRYKLNIVCKGYFYDDEVTLEYEGVKNATIERIGTRKAPVTIEIQAKHNVEDFVIEGFEDNITIEHLSEGQTITIDGESGLVNMSGVNAFNLVDLWKFPAITAERMDLSFNNSDDVIVKIRYKPMWL